MLRYGCLLSLWHFLTQPSPAVRDPQEQRSARLLATILIVVTPLFLFGRFMTELSGMPARNWNPPSFFAVVITVLLCGYCFSRTAYYRLGAILVIVALSATTLIQAALRATYSPGDLTNPLLWLVLLVLMSSLLLPWTVTALVIGANLAGILLLLKFVPSITFESIRFSLYFISAQSILMFVIIAIRRQDLRQLEQRSHELAESERRYRTLFEASFEGIILQENGVIVEVNPACEAIFGYAPKEFIGKPVLDFFAAEARDAIAANLTAATGSSYETIGLHKSGVRFDVEIHAKVIGYQGRPVQVAAVRDITARKQSEAQQLELLSEKERSRVLKQFVGDISHDLRTPLSTIKTSLYLLRKMSHDAEKAQGYMDNIEAQSNRLESLLDDLSRMSRLDAAITQFNMERADVNQLIEAVLRRNHILAEQKKHIVTFTPDTALPLLLADENKLRQAINNIVANALHYTPDGGTITVRSFTSDERIAVEVKDSGIGISADDLPRIFERFYRADRARQTDTGGTGVGLAIARKVVETHGGSIEVESAVGLGSTFRIWLPVKYPKAK